MPSRFENNELESLFRRYILRLQHTSITAAVALYVVLTAALATTSFVSVQSPTVRNLYDSAHCAVFVMMFLVLCTRTVDDMYLDYVCYGILMFSTSFCVLALPGRILKNDRMSVFKLTPLDFYSIVFWKTPKS